VQCGKMPGEMGGYVANLAQTRRWWKIGISKYKGGAMGGSHVLKKSADGRSVSNRY